MKKRKVLIPLLFIAPYLIVYLTFTAYPLIYSAILSVMKYKNRVMTWNGLKNFSFILSDPVFFKALKNTFLILILQVPLQSILAVALASFLNEKFLKCRGIFRMIVFMPILIDTVSYSIIFRMLFKEDGLVNNVLALLHIAGPNWLNSGVFAKAAIIIAVTWRWTGYNTVIILGGLQNIAGELYEAAAIDGATKFKQFLHVTIPGVKPVLLFSVILSVTGTLQLFTEPYLLTYGGPVNETLSVVQYLYQMGFKSFNFGAASAGAYILAVIICILTAIQMKVTKED